MDGGLGGSAGLASGSGDGDGGLPAGGHFLGAVFGEAGVGGSGGPGGGLGADLWDRLASLERGGSGDDGEKQAAAAALGVRDSFLVLHGLIARVDHNIGQLSPAEQAGLAPLRNVEVGHALSAADKTVKLIDRLARHLERHRAGRPDDGVSRAATRSMGRAIDRSGDGLWMSAARLSALAEVASGVSSSEAGGVSPEAASEAMDAGGASMAGWTEKLRARRDGVRERMIERQYRTLPTF